MSYLAVKRILIINTPGLFNKGGMAALMGALTSLRRTLPDARITIVCHHVSEDWETLKYICGKYNVTVIRHPWLKERRSRLFTMILSILPFILVFFQCLFGRIVNVFGIKSTCFLRNSDIILSLDIDTLHDHYGIFPPLWTLSNILLGVIAGKPVVVWGSGVGSFRGSIVRLISRFVLDRASLIIARDETSLMHLKKLGVKRPGIQATADHAFAMEPASKSRVYSVFKNEGITPDKRPLFAVIPSRLIHRFAFPGVDSMPEKYYSHVSALVKTVDYVIARFNVYVLLVCHTIMESEDDRLIAGDIKKAVKKRDRVSIIGDYLADEFKGVLGCCDLVIGERMHPMIASMSMEIPTVAVVYGEKSYGILGDMMGQRDYLVAIDCGGPDALCAALENKIKRAWQEKECIRQILKQKACIAREKALQNAIIIKSYLENINS